MKNRAIQPVAVEAFCITFFGHWRSNLLEYSHGLPRVMILGTFWGGCVKLPLRSARQNWLQQCCHHVRHGRLTLQWPQTSVFNLYEFEKIVAAHVWHVCGARTRF